MDERNAIDTVYLDLNLEKRKLRGNLIADVQHIQGCQKNEARQALQRSVAGGQVEVVIH